MFELELFELLNKLKKTNDEYETKKIKSSIANLIKDHSTELDNFLQSNALDPNAINTLKECEQIANESEEKTKNESDKNVKSDFEIIKSQFMKWLGIYNKNNKQITDENTAIVKEIINFYAQNRFEVIEQILKIDDSEDYEAFKWHLKNNLRSYFGKKVLEFSKSPEVEKLSFFQKRRKKLRLKQIMNDIAEYNFNKEEILEVLR